jgi:hypothetical protein
VPTMAAKKTNDKLESHRYEVEPGKYPAQMVNNSQKF